MTPDSPAYEVSVQQQDVLEAGASNRPLRSQASVGLDPDISFEVVSAALERLAGRHESLRTTFARPAGRRHPVQIVHAALPIALTTGDPVDASLPGWDDPLDTELGPVVRALLVPAESGQRLLLTAASAVADTRSLQLVADELAADLHGRPAGDDPVAYADYASWQRQQLQSDAGPPREVASWPTVVIATLPDADSGFDPARAPRSTPVPVGRDAATVLTQIGGFDAWVSAWAVLISRLAGEERVAMGLVVDDRTADELSDAIGPYSHVVPLEIEVDPKARLVDVAALVSARRASLGAADEATRLTRPGDGWRPAIQVEWLPTGPADVTPGLPPGCEARLLIRGSGGDTVAVLLSDPATIGAAQAGQIARSLAALIQSIADSPTGSVGDATALHPDDAAWLEDVLQGPAADSGPWEPVHARFLSQAERTPDRPAVSSVDRSLTYAELDRRANALAWRLVGLDVGQDAPVAIAMRRSIDQLVAILAVLKAGAPHLCLGLDQPSVRLAAQLEHARPSVVVTLTADRPALGPYAGLVIELDDDAAEADAPPDVAVGPADLAYLVYTSGSTGTPKGVAVTHGGLGTYTSFIVELCGLAADGAPRYGIVSALSTDLANTMLYPALVSGGCVELVPTEVAADPAEFARYVTAHPIDVLKVAPSHLEALLTAETDVLPRRILITGGEAATWDLVARVRSRSDCRILNHYGPTETTVGSAVYETSDASAGHRVRPTVPIGRPIAGTQFAIVDEAMRAVPPGAPGELLIGGAGLARGYWRDDTQTSERFVGGVESSGDRRYRSGDRVRCLPDGTVEFLGRLDGQVKIRGHRVETGEIVEALRDHPEVRRAAVVLRTEPPAAGRLVAYVVSDRDPGPSPSALREFLRNRLPDHMVPSAFVAVDAIPLTPSGKLDRLALPPPAEEGADADRERPFVGPSTTTEEVLAAIFGELLGYERISIHDDFFELGGHSLLATQVVARARAVFDIELPVHAVFTDPTVAQLALVIDAQSGPGDDEEFAALLREIESLSDEEAAALLAAETGEDSDL